MSGKIRVLISGACGRMGQETCRAVSGASDMVIAGASDVANVGRKLSDVAAGIESDVEVTGGLGSAIDAAKPDVMVDFTAPSAVMGNLRTVIARKIPVVVGTTGITQENLAELRELSAKNATPALVAPNFAIGAVLMMKFAAEAAKYMPSVEIIELHHDKKLDAPSGTSIKTAEMIAKAQGAGNREQGTVPAARGEEHFGVQIHSVRLPGFVAHQEVIFGGQGQTLTIRHDSIDRTSFMPGVLLAIRRVRELNGVVYGLDNIL
ncbi:MAG: 4-hydroxy-tetrahydrodipicolinate reductase [Armatimonadota bacterium]